MVVIFNMTNILLFTENGSIFGKRFIEDIVSFSKNINLIGVVTRPFKEEQDYYRDLNIDISKVAAKLNIPFILQTDDISNKNIINSLENMDVDYIFVCNYRLRLPDSIISIPNKMAINFHPSLLPNYAGLSPFFWMVRDKIIFSGVTALTITKGFDEGLIIKQNRINVSGCENSYKMMIKHFEAAYLLLYQILNEIESDSIKYLELQKQSKDRSYFSKPVLTDFHIKLTMTIDEALLIINSAYPYPCATLIINGIDIKIITAKITAETDSNNCILEFSDGYLEIFEMSIDDITYTGLTAKRKIEQIQEEEDLCLCKQE